MWPFDKKPEIQKVENTPLSKREILEKRLKDISTKKRILVRRQSYYNQAYSIDRITIEQYLAKLIQDELEVLVCLDSLDGEYS